MEAGRYEWWPQGLALAVLATLFGWVSRRTREAGLNAFALSFGLVAALYLGKNWLLGDYERSSWLGIVLAAAAAVSLLVGVCQYTVDAQHSPWLPSLALGTTWFATTVIVRAVAFMSPLTDYVSTSLLMLMLAALAMRAALREPNHGFAAMGAGFLLQPSMVLLAYFWALDPLRIRLITWIPFCVAGMTLLVVAQLRARERMSRELAARVQAEEALRAANETLEEKVKARTDELRGLVEGLKSFSRMVSHDLRGPLAGMTGLAELAIDTVGTADRSRLVELLTHISRQGRSCAELVNSLLTLAQAGDGDLVMQPTDLNSCVARAVEQVKLVRPEARRVQWRLGWLPSVGADGRLLEQVFVNLLGNAVKFSASAQQPVVEVGCQVEPGQLTFFVRDNGVGLDAQSLRLFEPFFRQHGAAFDGHGIGLSIVARVVQRHGGRVWCESKLGEGATFWFTLGKSLVQPEVALLFKSDKQANPSLAA